MSDLTQTGLVNLALREIGTYRIEDYDEESVEAEIARDVFGHTRRLCLSAHEWRFALRQVELTQSGVEPVGKWAYEYSLPGDFVRLGAVSDTQGMEVPLKEFSLVGLSILSSSAYCFVEYVWDHTTYGAWPAHFVHYFVAVLASEMASPLKATTERERLEKLAENRLMHSRSVDSIHQPVLFRPTGSWIGALRGARPR
jgi:hypothetical protein